MSGALDERAARRQAVLRARARLLAQPVLPPVPEGQSLEVLVFTLAAEHYAVETRHVREVQPLRQLTPLPCTPAFVRGIVNVRGRILPVLDLKQFLGLPQSGLTDHHRIILVGDATQEFGILADLDLGVRRLDLAALQPAPTTLGHSGAAYVQGVTAEQLVMLDLERVLSDPRILVDEGNEDATDGPAAAAGPES